MSMEEIKKQILDLPEVAAWQDMTRILKQHAEKPHRVWEWPFYACRAVGGDESLAAPCAAAILSLISSLMLVDDMLDEDPRGAHLQLGEAVTANISFAFLSASFRILSGMPVDDGRKATVMQAFAEISLAMAFGQELDSRNLSGEEDYWKVAHAKSAASFGMALYSGAVMGNADAGTTMQIRKLGELLGEVIQIHDDLKDAMETPANPDWKQMRNNLLFLYAKTADHPDRERFLCLQPRVDDLEALQEAQKILVRCGAASYCMYHIFHRYQACRKILRENSFKDPTPLEELVVQSIQPLKGIMNQLGIPIPRELMAA